ncbi:MAG: exopolysaccharide biosynthesis protein, partial [Nitrospira sp.]|nr:exopolysaccharide biosynthesis protein [Nitrospira sp.]
LPIPLTNFPPGWGILIMSLGLLSKDGITILIGMIIGTIGVGITMIILVLLWMGMSLPTFY